MHFHRDLLAVCECFSKHRGATACRRYRRRNTADRFYLRLAGLFLFPAHQGAATVLIEQYTPESLLETQRLGVTVLYTAPTIPGHE